MTGFVLWSHKVYPVAERQIIIAFEPLLFEHAFLLQSSYSPLKSLIDRFVISIDSVIAVNLKSVFQLFYFNLMYF